MASTPKLASCSTTPAGYIAVPLGSEVYIFILKAHRGAPWRELETFTQTALLASQLGSVFFDLDPQRVEIFDQTFELITALNTTGNIIRFYWNPPGTAQIRQMEYDVSTNQITAPPTTTSFTGRDPFVLDARTGPNPNRLYMVYIDGDAQMYRVSDDVGATWGAAIEVDPPGSLVRLEEAAIEDPLTDRAVVGIIQKRDITPPTFLWGTGNWGDGNWGT